MKKYTRPELGVSLFSCDAIVTASGAGSNGYTEELTTWQNANSGAQLTKAKMSQLQDVVKFTF